MMVSAAAIDALLPQTQCGECGYPGCLPYAQALAEGGASINKCPPGGINTLYALGHLLKIDPTPYVKDVVEKTRTSSLAVIRESECIGCTKCIQACPVDAIVGSATLMHTVIAHECTGCGLCVEPCPVDCIEMVKQPSPVYDPSIARARFNAKHIRLLREAQEKQKNYREKRYLAAITQSQKEDKQAKQAYVLQALARVKSKKNE